MLLCQIELIKCDHDASDGFLADSILGFNSRGCNGPRNTWSKEEMFPLLSEKKVKRKVKETSF